MNMKVCLSCCVASTRIKECRFFLEGRGSRVKCRGSRVKCLGSKNVGEFLI